ncbi:hypothetical protein G7066_13540 [Leucobacter coleopterorum]|uniref:Uncharacterized protein n=1 Tax=Leucobacter coleopterorum TaxID=2714933 RepID=A0ABX6K2B4_9MICO|nr:hypothetical protein [Leucobacter coleopterorum]QIM19339.1 hypothetical protein G7066_13540 [Leucobacter coleopterorum]
MAKGKVIAVHKDTHDLVKEVRHYDPAPPSEAEMEQTSGVKNDWVKDYPKRLGEFGVRMRREFADQLRVLQADLDISLGAIKELQDLDEEIARQLKALNSDVPTSKAPKAHP